ncbi:hypothetical protein BCV72DRAFT_268150 [Rhizopus microsporus var. microsporus]|uniref:Uncharacterized protein n=2 Tax=Rhizopus microsporus TaxID=58291 RepID=A0A2G4T748_RHIZD|nr:uncharacterized protein RHIMIDRAFT_252173 [Rhizopus microsporus ATCC 52813]ORE10947.1 hypothetical protein BCV72DRAFT_268150 [Rhizopus microsporus var. microsporus]PHZ16854.1 hypothetical protein RHIMIDRAFT_252173 [Rhizopus microsporus ATCC 52813]
MKFIYLASFAYAAVVATAQLTAPTRNYNVTSPVTNGPYVVGQILPCTYRLFSDVDTSALNLEIDLEAAPQGVSPQGTNTTTLPIAVSADVSKTDAFIKREGNLTYYEHSINFNIPQTVKPGNYHVVFFDKSTNTKLSIPIEIRPAASSTSVGTKATSISIPGRPQSSGSIFAQGAASSIVASKVLIALMAVAGVAFLL